MRTIDREKVLKSFFDAEGRLKQIPVKKSKRDIVMDRLAEEFEAGHRYHESEVNQILLRFHEDFATIRRELVDTRRMGRAEGYYWRSVCLEQWDPVGLGAPVY